MRLNKNYTVVSDNNNWILKYESDMMKKEDGTEYVSKDKWYYSKLQDLLLRFMDNCIKDCGTAKEVLEKLEEVEYTIKNLKL